MLRASVPEAAVNEDGEALVSEHEVRPAREGLVAAPTLDAVCSEYGNQDQFSLLVSLGANSRHDATALFLCENVRHREILVSQR